MEIAGMSKGAEKTTTLVRKDGDICIVTKHLYKFTFHPKKGTMTRTLLRIHERQAGKGKNPILKCSVVEDGDIFGRLLYIKEYSVGKVQHGGMVLSLVLYEDDPQKASSLFLEKLNRTQDDLWQRIANVLKFKEILKATSQEGRQLVQCDICHRPYREACRNAVICVDFAQEDKMATDVYASICPVCMAKLIKAMVQIEQEAKMS